MTASKAIFLKDNDLLKWWIQVVHDPRFDKIKIFTRADIMEQRPTGDQMIGCELTLDTLESLINPEAEAFDINDAGVGLHHNLTHQRPLDREETKKED